MTVNLYEYCLGHGIAGWELSAEPHKIRVKDFTLNESNITIAVGDTAHLQAIITPADATDQNVTWRYSPTNRSTKLNSNGLTATLTSTKENTYTITATLGDFTAECVVTVTKTTGVQDIIPSTEETRKLIHNGQVQIQHKGETYGMKGEKF